MEDDPVYQAVRQLPELLRRVPFDRELTNGNLEKELKIFIAAALHGKVTNSKLAAAPYVCVMDKKFNGAPLDLLAMQKAAEAAAAPARPRFWIEMKCSFREHNASSLRKASEAVAEIQDYVQLLGEPHWGETQRYPHLEAGIRRFRDELVKCPKYIVHVRNSTPQPNSGLPQFVLAKFPAGEPMSCEELAARYTEKLNTAGLADQLEWLEPIDPLMDDPAIPVTMDAVIIKLKPQHERPG